MQVSKGTVKNLDQMNLSFALTPFDKATGTLCACDFRGSSLMAPIDLLTSPDKSKLFRSCMVPLAQALKAAIKTIQDSPYRNNSFFYNTLKRDSRSEPKERDICMVLGQGLNSVNRFGMITKVKRTSVTVRFPDGHEQDYANGAVVLLVRPPKTSTKDLESG